MTDRGTVNRKQRLLEELALVPVGHREVFKELLEGMANEARTELEIAETELRVRRLQGAIAALSEAVNKLNLVGGLR